MSEPTNLAESTSRRRFLHTLAVLGGSAAVPLSLSSAAHALTPVANARLRVGVALPALDNKNSATASSWNGLQLALANAPHSMQLEMASKGSWRTQVENLSRSGSDLIMGAVTPRIAREIGKTLQGTHTVFLNVEPGAQMQHAQDLQANVFQHTLQLWQAHYATGEAAIARGQRAAILSSFHESGYDGTAAFIAGFESAGGTVVSQFVHRGNDESKSLSQALAALQQGQPDLIYVNAGGVLAEKFMQAVGTRAVPSPVIATGMPLDSAFLKNYQQTVGRPADAHALLGYEAGQLLLSAATRMSGQSMTLHSALAQAHFDSPRGRVKMQAETQTTTATAYVNAQGEILGHLTVAQENQARSHAGWTHAVSGWTLPHGTDTQSLRA